MSEPKTLNDYVREAHIHKAAKRKPRFECDVCGANRETVTCNGDGCCLKVCLDCLKSHEKQCIARLGDMLRSRERRLRDAR